MKVCEKSDFESRGFKFDDNLAAPYNYRLCPDMTEENKEHYVLKNLYTNQEERLNFAIEIYKC